LENNNILNRALKFFATLFFVLVAPFSFSQVVVEPDSTKTGYSKGNIEAPNPTSILEAYTYDPVTDRYIYSKTFDGFNINYPIILTPQQYEELILRESMRKYYQEKLSAVDGQKAGSEEAKRDLLPRYYVNSKLFESIFGSNTIDIKPTGSVEMDLGIRFTKQDNPSLSPRNRKNLTFDFNQRISMGLQGKVGTRLNVNVNYDTQSTFAFQNLIKLEYTPTEDDIIQKIEVGNVSLPINSTLIRGAQSLFGVKAQLQFGKTTVTGVFSEQKSQTKTVNAEGGATIQDFSLFAQEYDNDRHYFLSQYFRNNYDNALANYPYINSRIQINRIEVWVTNKQNRVNTQDNNLRNIIGLQDLGESQLAGIPDSDVVGIQDPNFFNVIPNSPSDNSNNKFDPQTIGTTGYLNDNIRNISTVNSGFNVPSTTVVEGKDYVKLENARKLSANEFTYHPQLGYISLNQRLSNDEVLAVSYQYTIGSEVYQVGEFGTDGVEATQVTDNSGIATPSSQSLILKMLKGTLVNVNQPVWDLMMKNIYQIPGGYQLENEGFRFNILYTDPSPINYIKQVGSTPLPDNVEQTPLIKVFNLDKLNYTNDAQEGGDGFFDFVPGITIDPQFGRIIFTNVEPFGKLLFDKLKLGTEDYNIENSYNPNQDKYVFKNLYDKTQAQALQDSEKNKFQLKGRYKSTSGDGIPIGAFNVPQGSVVVTAGGRVLVEGVDYTVNYQLGRVYITDGSLSNTPIQVSLENNAVFGQQTRRFWGANVEHKFNENFLIGGTILNMTERPFTQKTDYNQDAVNNTIFGFNANYATEVPFLTRLANKLPNIDTDVPSNLSFRGEIAYLKPGASKTSNFNGESTVYIDDFEGSQTTIDMRSASAWSIASTPVGFGEDANDLTYNDKRAKMSWYSIDPVFYTQTPTGIGNDDLSLNNTRRIFSRELYPQTDIAQGQTQVISTLDLSYYPTERGPYNFNPNATDNTLPNGQDNWGGIMRSINSTNFVQSNVEYIQFWVLDPYYNEQGNPVNINNNGKLVFNLGEISEDILKDGKKLYENGLPEAGALTATNPSIWGKTPASQSLIYAFDTNEANRAVQDVGLNGLSDAEEAAQFPLFAGNPDPAADNYQFYLSAPGNSVVGRYKNYNGTQGNSPVNVADTNRGSTTFPDVEDINRDNTMNTINAYYKFEVNIQPNQQVGSNYAVDVREVNEIDLPNGNSGKSRWIQYKIPIQELATDANAVGSISDLLSVRFMRMYMTGFDENITLRFGALDLVRGEWRRFNAALDQEPNNDNDATGFDVVSVNIQENGNRSPIHYVAPPGVQREQLYNNNTIINQNEQSLSLRVYDPAVGSYVDGLEPGDARAVFKNVNVDMRQFKKLRMFLHAEALPNPESNPLHDDEMVAFIRFGNDFTQNFYQIEMPLKVTAQTATSADDIWPADNEINLPLSLLTKLKVLALSNDSGLPPADANGIIFIEEEDLLIGSSDSKLTLGIKGNPNFGLVRTLMVGIKNKNGSGPIRGEVWFNELRMSDMDNKGGYAAVANLDTNMADFATLSATGRLNTIGFGSLEQGPNERSREDTKQYDIVTNFNLGKLLPNKWGINLPFNYAIGEQIITPKFDPYYQDIELQQLIDVTTDQAEKNNIKERAIDYTKRQSINFIGVRKDRAPDQKQHIYDVENLTLTYSYNETQHHDFQVESLDDKQVKTAVDYAYTFKPSTIEPFKKTKAFSKGEYYKALKDFNFNFLPTSIAFSSNILRQFNKQQFRQVEVGLPLEPLYRRNYFFNYNYGFNYKLTKSLSFVYNANSNNLVQNYLDENNVPNNSYGVWDNYWDTGFANQHNQQLIVNYELPISKLPFLGFIKSNYSYTSDYNWTRNPYANITIDQQDIQLGNTIQNANSHTLNTVLNMDILYKALGVGKKKNVVKSNPAPPKPGEKITAKPKVTASGDGNKFAKALISVLTSVKNVQINYKENNGTILPGFLPGVGFFGTTKPTVGFVLGSQSDIRYEAAKNGYLTNFQDFNQNFTQVKNRQLNFTAQMELFKDFKIDLSADRTLSQNFSEQYDVSPDGSYNSRSPYNYGNYNISTVMLKTAFKTSDQTTSQAFQDFRENRIIVANRLAQAYYGGAGYATDAEGYPVGFGKNSQQVLLPSFLAAYTGLVGSKGGESAGKISLDLFRNIPIPNWNIKYTGLMNYKWFKDKFKRFSLQHGYRASYGVNSFRSNLNGEIDPVTGLNQDQNGNIYAKKIVSNVNLAEQFNPLIRFDLETKSSLKFLAEMKKDRTLNMSFDNNLLTEVKGNEYTFGVGYRIKDVTISSKLADNPTGVIKSDVNLKADFSIRKNTTIVRYLDYDNNQLSGGQNLMSIKFTADYSFSKNFTAIFYYDHQFSKAVISTAFPLTTIRAGFTLRYNFGN
jgi:cell surface protein SprA